MTTVVTTVLNDREGCAQFLAEMLQQTCKPGEIVVVDAGSRDGTWELLQAEAVASWPWRLIALQERGCNIARGRNLAIKAASHEIIVSTDVGCHWAPEWLEELAAPLFADPDCEAVMGSWKVRFEDQQTPWARADPMLRSGLELRATPTSCASSRAIAYRKDLWQRIGGYPEDLTLAADDLVFAMLLRRIARRVSAAPVPRCVWSRPQRFMSLVKEARRNFRGSAEAGLWLDYFVLVGGRIAAEWISFAGLIFAWSVGFPMDSTILAGLVVFLLFVWRLQSWLAFRRVIAGRGGTVALWRVAVLDYTTRLAAVRGFFDGLVYGAGHCQACRCRLRRVSIGWWQASC